MTPRERGSRPDNLEDDILDHMAALMLDSSSLAGGMRAVIGGNPGFEYKLGGMNNLSASEHRLNLGRLHSVKWTVLLASSLDPIVYGESLSHSVTDGEIRDDLYMHHVLRDGQPASFRISQNSSFDQPPAMTAILNNESLPLSFRLKIEKAWRHFDIEAARKQFQVLADYEGLEPEQRAIITQEIASRQAAADLWLPGMELPDKSRLEETHDVLRYVTGKR